VPRYMARQPAVSRGFAAPLRMGATLSDRLHLGSWLGAALLAPFVACAPLMAETLGDADGPARKFAQAQKPAAPPAEQPRADAPEQPSAPAAGNSALKQRVEQLEEQLVDMQVIIGTLESLARGGGGAGTPAGAGPGMSAAADIRIDGLETQVRALAAQIEQLTQQVRDLSNTPRRTDATGAAPAAAPAGPPPRKAADTGRFGSTTVTAGTEDAIGGLIDGSTPEAAEAGAPGAKAEAAAAGAPAAAAPTKTEAATAETLADVPPAFMPPPGGVADADNPKQLYETAYGYLMQRDYGAAQTAFESFLTRYPKDSLAGNAQYWLGEAHFVRGEYKAAANSFLKGYQNYASNARAADSLLKLAMSLDRLGQTDAACSSFAELSTRFPDAPENVKTRAKSERQRIGCR